MAMSTRSKTGGNAGARVTAQSPSKTPTKTARPVISKKRTVRGAPSRGAPSSSQSSGNLLPDVSLLCDDGQTRPLYSLITDDTPGLVLFTYPRANTGGCTAQASGLSAFVDEAATLGYSIVGASYDSVKSQASWKAKLDLKCRLLCDTLDTGLLKKINAHKAPKSVKRSVFIIRKGGLDSKGDDPSIVESRIVISPKDCISFVQQYVRDHPHQSEENAVQKDDKEAGKKESEVEAEVDGGKDEKLDTDN